MWSSEGTAQVEVVGGVHSGPATHIPLGVLCPDAFEIRRLSSVFLRVRTNVGVRVLYDREGLRLYLQVDQRWVEDTVGLCGTFNGNTQDDFLYVPLPWNRKEGEGAKYPNLPNSHGLSGSWYSPLIIYFSACKFKYVCVRQ